MGKTRRAEILFSFLLEKYVVVFNFFLLGNLLFKKTCRISQGHIDTFPAASGNCPLLSPSALIPDGHIPFKSLA